MNVRKSIRIENIHFHKKTFKTVTSAAFLLIALLTSPPGVRPQIGPSRRSQAEPVITLEDANLSGISADGRRIAVSPEIGLDEVYDVATKRRLQMFRVADSFGGQLSADGKRLLVFAPVNDGSSSPPGCGVLLFDVDGGQQVRRASTCVNYDGKFVGGVVLFIPQKEGRTSADLRLIAGPASAASLESKSPSVKPGVWLWDVEKQKMARTFGVYSEFDRWDQTRLTPDGRVLAATRFNQNHPENSETIVWDAQSGRALLRLPFTSRWLALSDDGRRLVTTVEGKSPDKNDRTEITVTPQGQVYADSQTDRRPTNGSACRPPTEIWDVSTGSRISQIGDRECNRFPTTGGALSPDGKYLATASLNYVLVWDASTGRLVAAQPHDESDRDRVRSVVFSGDGNYLAMSSMNEVVKVWRIADVLTSASKKGGIAMSLQR